MKSIICRIIKKRHMGEAVQFREWLFREMEGRKIRVMEQIQTLQTVINETTIEEIDRESRDEILETIRMLEAEYHRYEIYIRDGIKRTPA